MLVKFKRALFIDGAFYQPGVLDVPDEKLKHTHFIRYIKLGIVVPPEAEEIQEKTETAQDRAERLLAKEKELEAKRKELLKKVEPPPEKKKGKKDGKADDEGKSESDKG